MSTEVRINNLLDEMERKFENVCNKYTAVNIENLKLKTEIATLKQKIRTLEGK